MIKRIYILLVRFGINPITMWKSIIGIPFLLKMFLCFTCKNIKAAKESIFILNEIIDLMHENGYVTYADTYINTIFVEETVRQSHFK